MTLTERLIADGLMSIVRHVSPDELLPTAQALAAGGVKFMEVTMNTDRALESIALLSEHFADGDLVIGAGTVMNADMARAAVGAGARFLVSPHTDPALIAETLELGAVPVPGVMTPSDVAAARNAGAHVLKLFPAATMGPDYVRHLLAPFNGTAFFAVGGVDMTNAVSFLNAGACGLGLGTSLVDPKIVAQGNFRAITDRARTYRDILNEARG